MTEFNLKTLNAVAQKKFQPFLEEVLGCCLQKIHSVHVTGTSITADFDESDSDVNSIFVLKEMDLKFLETIAPLGKKYSKQRVAAPLIMTPDYIRSSLDVFPVEFLNFRLLHATVYGQDILKEVEIEASDLRHQCERELKTRLIWLRQGYISSMGNTDIILDGLKQAITGYIPLFRAIIYLFNEEPPVRHQDVISSLSSAASIDTGIFSSVLKEKHGKKKFKLDELNTLFEDFYAATERLGKIVDAFEK